MIVIPLPIKKFENGEEVFQIRHYFDPEYKYEVAVGTIDYLKRPSKIFSIKTNILEYTPFNPDQILVQLSPRHDQITEPIYHKIGVASLKDLRLVLTDFETQAVSITLFIRRIYGEEKV